MVDSGGNFVYGFRCNAQATATATAQFDAATTPLCVPVGVLLEDIKINSLGEVTGKIKSLGNADVGDATYGAELSGAKEGDIISLGKVAIATFQNPEGLTKQGGYYYGADPSDNTDGRLPRSLQRRHCQRVLRDDHRTAWFPGQHEDDHGQR